MQRDKLFCNYYNYNNKNSIKNFFFRGGQRFTYKTCTSSHTTVSAAKLLAWGFNEGKLIKIQLLVLIFIILSSPSPLWQSRYKNNNNFASLLWHCMSIISFTKHLGKFSQKIQHYIFFRKFLQPLNVRQTYVCLVNSHKIPDALPSQT